MAIPEIDPYESLTSFLPGAVQNQNRLRALEEEIKLIGLQQQANIRLLDAQITALQSRANLPEEESQTNKV